MRSGGGVGFLSLLGLLFIGLKLGGVIDWSWWWITAPLWALPAFVIASLVVILLTLVLAVLVGWLAGDR